MFRVKPSRDLIAERSLTSYMTIILIIASSFIGAIAADYVIEAPINSFTNSARHGVFRCDRILTSQDRADCELKERLLNNFHPNEAFNQYPPFAQGLPLHRRVLERETDTESAHSTRTRPVIGTVCPGYPEPNIDDNRMPSEISEWKCSCKTCQLPRMRGRRFRCKPINRLVSTMRREREGGEWRFTLEPIAVACRCEEAYTPLTAVNY